MPAKRKRQSSSAVQSSPVRPSAVYPSSAAERFDENGDLTLIVGDGDEKREFFVCSRALARASPVFRQMLFGSFRESRSSQNSSDPWVVTIPEDSAEAAHRLLSIVHGRFMDIPKALMFTELHSILVFTDKYDMNQSIRPWVNDWLPSCESWQCENEQDTFDFTTQIGVAWGLGDDENFEDLSKQLIHESTINEKGQLSCFRNGGWKPIEDLSMPLAPLGFLERVEDARNKLIVKIFRRLKMVIFHLQELTSENASADIPRYCTNRGGSIESQVACHALTLGAIVAGLRRLGPKAVWDCESLAADYRESVNYLYDEICTIRSDLWRVLGSRHSASCNPIPKLVAELQGMMSLSTLTIDDSVRLEANRERLGITYENR